MQSSITILLEMLSYRGVHLRVVLHDSRCNQMDIVHGLCGMEYMTRHVRISAIFYYTPFELLLQWIMDRGVYTFS